MAEQQMLLKLVERMGARRIKKSQTKHQEPIAFVVSILLELNMNKITLNYMHAIP